MLKFCLRFQGWGLILLHCMVCMQFHTSRSCRPPRSVLCSPLFPSQAKLNSLTQWQYCIPVSNAVDEVQVPAVVVVPKILGSAESVRVEVVLGLFLPVQVSGHQVGALDADFSDLTRTTSCSRFLIFHLES